MEITQGISLYLYLKLAKISCFSYYLLCFSSTTSENKRAGQFLPGSGVGEGKVVKIMYTHVSKCKNDTS
jgi:hypothetical protein